MVMLMDGHKIKCRAIQRGSADWLHHGGWPSGLNLIEDGLEQRGAGGCDWSSATARRTGRIWPLQKSSSVEDMAAAEGDGKRDKKSKSMQPPLPARVGLAGTL
jgi:hypothetical protein